jgi:hypothetical protein
VIKFVVFDEREERALDVNAARVESADDPPVIDDRDSVCEARDLVEVMARARIAAPAAARRSSDSRSKMTPFGSSAIVGSSRMTSRGSCWSAHASPTR